MKAVMGMFVVAGAVGLVTGCAHMQGESGYVAPDATPSLQDQDALYIAKVEQIAQRRGVEVVWINPPAKGHVRSRDPRQAMR